MELQSIINNEEGEKKAKLLFIGIGFMICYFSLLLLDNLFQLFYFIPQFTALDFLFEAYPVLFYLEFLPVIVGLILIIIGFTKLKNSIIFTPQKTLQIRNSFFIPLIFRPLSIIFFILLAFSAWGDDIMEQVTFTGIHISNYIFVLIPLIVFSINVIKELKVRNQKVNILYFPIILLLLSVLWTIGYLIMLFLFFNVFHYEEAGYLVIILVSISIQIIFNSLAITVFSIFLKLFKYNEKPIITGI
ncbi:MAG: hypothetical protein ACFFDW_11965 [Candidatus Thorarchaeota archaeon]